LPESGFSKSSSDSTFDSFTALSVVAKMVCSTLALNPLLQLIADIVVDVLGVPASTAFFLRDTDQLVLKFTKDLPDEFAAELGSQRETLGKIAARQKKAIVVEGVSGDPRAAYARKLEGVTSCIALPFCAKETAVGAMELYVRTRFLPSAQQIEVLETVASLCAMAIENARLYENLKESYETLKNTQTQLIQREKLASIGQLIAGIAHELKNPLTSVISYAQLVLDTVGPTWEHIDQLRAVQTNAKRCKELIENLLHYSRPSSLRLEKHSIVRILDDVVNLLSYELKSHGLELVRHYSPDARDALVDYQQMMQMFVNLIMNAMQATSKGGRLTLTVECSAKPDFVTVKISDTGCGISEENLPRLFEPFFTTRERSEGTGLGLYIVYGIINRHNGTITAESQVGVGTTFTLNLPAAQV
jgi:signal transduction histidine kinase